MPINYPPLPGPRGPAGAVRSVNLFDKSSVADGSILADGSVSSSGALSNYQHSDHIPVVGGQTYTGSGSTLRFHAFFGSSGAVVGGSNSTATTVVAPSNADSIRVSIDNPETFQFEVGSVATEYQNFGYDFQRLSVSIEDVTFIGRSRNLFNSAATVEGFMGQTGALSANTNSTDYVVSDHIPVEPGQYYGGSSDGASMRFHAFFNSAGQVVGGSNSTANQITIPNGAATVRVTIARTALANFQFEKGSSRTAFVNYGNAFTEASGLWQTAQEPATAAAPPKLWATLGDSITSQRSFQPLAALAMGFETAVYGVGGTTLCVRTDGSNLDVAISQDTRINAITSGADIVTVMAGTNDWAQSFPIGDADSSNPSEFNGALNDLVVKIRARFPTQVFAIATPPFGDFPTSWPGRGGWTDPQTNGLGLTTADYAEAVRLACLRHGVACIDVNDEAGLNTGNADTHMVDDGANLHPNALGASKIAKVYVSSLALLIPRIESND